MKGFFALLFLISVGPALADYKCTGQLEQKSFELLFKAGASADPNERKIVAVTLLEKDHDSNVVSQTELKGTLTKDEQDDFGMYKFSTYALLDAKDNAATLNIVKSSLPTRGGRGGGFSRIRVTAELKYLEQEYFYDCKTLFN